MKEKAKATRMKTSEPSEEAPPDSEEKGRWEHEKALEHPPCQRKTEGGLAK
jgi:hypothetical protein